MRSVVGVHVLFLLAEERVDYDVVDSGHDMLFYIQLVLGKFLVKILLQRIK